MKPDNYPQPLRRVTGGPGGEAVLIMGSRKTALHDCGMACFKDRLIENIRKELGERNLDYILLSHSHYDHMGALPYLLEIWPEAKVCAGLKASKVFQSQGARATIESMGRTAAEYYGMNPESITAEGLRVDVVLENGHIIRLGDEEILAMETKGHTDCSMSYFIQPQGILLASESTGALELSGKLHTSALKSFDQSLESAFFLKLLPYRYILIPHYGILPREMNDTYFDMYAEEAIREKNLIEGWIKEGLTEEEIFEKHKELYWNDIRAVNHPYRAYKMNTDIIIKRMIKEAAAHTTVNSR